MRRRRRRLTGGRVVIVKGSRARLVKSARTQRSVHRHAITSAHRYRSNRQGLPNKALHVIHEHSDPSCLESSGILSSDEYYLTRRMPLDSRYEVSKRVLGLIAWRAMGLLNFTHGVTKTLLATSMDDI
jgi:hypothetical protein